MKKSSEKIPVFFSRNMSVGINLLIELSKKAAKLLGEDFNIEILEAHHNQKLDAPSGTALMIADEISQSVDYEAEYVYDRHEVRRKREKNEIGIHSIRGGTIVGQHSVIFAGPNEEITLSHQAESRAVFANGALHAAEFILNKPAGMYDMSDVVKGIL
jgi:4-hydroxy-tetrahydrodipicolinate reductase